jgi:hypothetical protein
MEGEGEVVAGRLRFLKTRGLLRLGSIAPRTLLLKRKEGWLPLIVVQAIIKGFAGYHLMASHHQALKGSQSNQLLKVELRFLKSSPIGLL